VTETARLEEPPEKRHTAITHFSTASGAAKISQRLIGGSEVMLRSAGGLQSSPADDGAAEGDERVVDVVGTAARFERNRQRLWISVSYGVRATPTSVAADIDRRARPRLASTSGL
jgi:hypothetical protein